jgi:peptidoglycan/LPS O-acetylase OafA/YrhL
MIFGGECSYSIYLLHPFVFRFAIIGKPDFAGIPEFMARLALFVVIATAIASLFYKYVERPSKAWLRGAFRDHRRRETPSSGSEVLSLE